MRENAYTKGRLYLTEGRLVILEIRDDGRITAQCRGDGKLYHLGHDHTWWCSCPAMSIRCSHLTALKLVTVATKRLGTVVRIRANGDASQFGGQRERTREGGRSNPLPSDQTQNLSREEASTRSRTTHAGNPT